MCVCVLLSIVACVVLAQATAVGGQQWLVQRFFSKKNMAVVAPPGAVATALGTVPYWEQAGSASDTRPHRAVPVDGAHRARSLTCPLTAGPAQRKALATRHCRRTTTRRRLRVGGVPTNTYLNPPRPPDRCWRSPSGSAVATGRTDDPPFCCQRCYQLAAENSVKGGYQFFYY